MIHRALLAALLLATVLRTLPLLAPPLGVELDAAYPRNAVRGVVERDWKPFSPVHGALLPDVLRALMTLRYGAGRASGRYAERVDMLADFVRDPLPFVVLGRVVMAVVSLAGVWVTALLAARLGGPLAGPAAAVLLGASYIHVRESLHIWPDAFAATWAIAAVLAALVHLERGTSRTAIILGASAGLALASKFSLAPLALAVVPALVLGGGATASSRLRHLLTASAVALPVFLVASPHVVLDWAVMVFMMRIQAAGSFAAGGAARIAWPTLLSVTLGVGPLVLAILGAGASVARRSRAAVVAVAFPVAYLAILARANPYARYFAIAAPFVAAFGGVGAAAIAERLAPRHAGAVAALVVAVACAVPLQQSWQHVALLERPDTRVLAGDWLAANVEPGTAVTLPNITPYANPVVPPDAFTLRIEYPSWHRALAARGLPDPARSYRIRYQGLLSNYDGGFVPRDPVVVTAEHPAPNGALATPAVNVERLRAAGYRVAARFEGVPEPAPPGLLYDPQDADYEPLRGAEYVPHPGPTLTLWRAP